MIFALWSSHDHIPIKYRGPIKKTSNLRTIYLIKPFGFQDFKNNFHLISFTEMPCYTASRTLNLERQWEKGHFGVVSLVWSEKTSKPAGWEEWWRSCGSYGGPPYPRQQLRHSLALLHLSLRKNPPCTQAELCFAETKEIERCESFQTRRRRKEDFVWR